MTHLLSTLIRKDRPGRSRQRLFDEGVVRSVAPGGVYDVEVGGVMYTITAATDETFVVGQVVWVGYTAGKPFIIGGKR